eukprot:scaffold49_cov82-Skeletonema_dohrnii-CCMP3373.AAC.6
MSALRGKKCQIQNGQNVGIARALGIVLPLGLLSYIHITSSYVAGGYRYDNNECCEKDVRNIRHSILFSRALESVGIRFCGLLLIRVHRALGCALSLGRPGHVRTDPSPPTTQFGGTFAQKQEVPDSKSCFLANISSEAGVGRRVVSYHIYNG